MGIVGQELIPDKFQGGPDPLDALEEMQAEKKAAQERIAVQEGQAAMETLQLPKTTQTDEEPQQQVPFDPTKYTQFIDTTPEDDLMNAAKHQGINYVQAQKHRQETIKQYEKIRFDKFTNRPDISKKTKDFFSSDEMRDLPDREREPLAFLDKITTSLLDDFTDTGTNVVTGVMSIFETYVRFQLKNNPEDKDMQALLADLAIQKNKMKEGLSEDYRQYQKDVQEGGIAESLGTVLGNPIHTGKTLAEMMVMFAPTMGITAAGTTTGGPLQGAILGAGSLAYQEQAFWMEEWFQDHKLDITNKDHIAKVFDDPELRDQMFSEMEIRGASMAAFQLAMGPIIAKFSPALARKMGKILGMNTGKKAVFVKKMTDLAGETVSEMGSEVFSRGVTKGELTYEDWKEGWLEGIYGMATAGTRAAFLQDWKVAEEQKRTKKEQVSKTKAGKEKVKQDKPPVQKEGETTPKEELKVKSAIPSEEGKGGIDPATLSPAELEKLDKINSVKKKIQEELQKRIDAGDKELKSLGEDNKKRESLANRQATLEEAKKMIVATNPADLEKKLKELETMSDEDLKKALGEQVEELKKLTDVPPTVLKTDEEVERFVEELTVDEDFTIEHLDEKLKDFKNEIKIDITRKYLKNFFKMQGKNIPKDKKIKIAKNFLQNDQAVEDMLLDKDDDMPEEVLLDLIYDLREANLQYLKKQLKGLSAKKNLTPEDRVKRKIYANFVYFFKNNPGDYDAAFPSIHDVELAIRMIKGASRLMGIDMNILADKFIIGFNSKSENFYSPLTNMIQIDTRQTGMGAATGNIHHGKLLIFHEVGHFVMNNIYQHYKANPNPKTKKFLEFMFRVFKNNIAITKVPDAPKNFNEFMEFSQAALDRYAGMMQPLNSVMKKRIEYLEKIYEKLARTYGTDQYDVDFTALMTAEMKSIFFDLLVLSENLESSPLVATETLERMGLESWYTNHLLTTITEVSVDESFETFVERLFGIYQQDIFDVKKIFQSLDSNTATNADYELEQPLPKRPMQVGKKYTPASYDWLMYTRKSIFEILSDNMNLTRYVINYKELQKDIAALGLNIPVFDLEIELNAPESEIKRMMENYKALKRQMGLNENIPLLDSYSRIKIDNRKLAVIVKNEENIIIKHQASLESIAVRVNKWRMKKWHDILLKTDGEKFGEYQQFFKYQLADFYKFTRDYFKLYQDPDFTRSLQEDLLVIAEEDLITQKQHETLSGFIDEMVELANETPDDITFKQLNLFDRMLKEFIRSLTKEQLNYVLGHDANPSLIEKISNSEVLGFEPKKALTVKQEITKGGKRVKAEVVNPATPEAQQEMAESEQLRKEYEGFKAHRWSNLFTKILKALPVIGKTGEWSQLPQHLFERLGEYKALSGFMKLFNKMQDAFTAADNAWSKQQAALKDIVGKHKELFFDSETVSRNYNSRKTGYKIKGISDLIYILMNMGNSKNVTNILNSQVVVDNKEKKTLRELITEGIENELKRKPVAARRKQLEKYKFSKKGAYEKIVMILKRMKEANPNGSIYDSADFPFLLKALLDFYDNNFSNIQAQGITVHEIQGGKIEATNVNAQTIEKMIDGLLAGYFLNDIIGNKSNKVPIAAFRFVENIWKEFKRLHGPLKKAYDKVGRPIGEVSFDMGTIIFPWFEGGGYFPIRENRAGNTEDVSVWLPHAKSWSDPSFTKRRTGKDHGDILPTGVDLAKELGGIMRSMVRTAHLLETYEYVAGLIGPKSNLWNHFKAFSPEVMPVIKGWLQRVQMGSLSYNQSQHIKIMQWAVNKIKMGQMFLKLKTTVEQLGGLAIPSGHNIPAKVVVDIAAKTIMDLKNSYRFMMENSKTMANAHEQTGQIVDLYDLSAKHIFPELDPNKGIRNMKQVLRGVNAFSDYLGNKGYIPLREAQMFFVNTIYWNVHYHAAITGQIEGRSFTHEEAAQLATNAVTSTQFLFRADMASQATASAWFKLYKMYTTFFIGLRSKMANLIHQRLKYEGGMENPVAFTKKMMPLAATIALMSIPGALWFRLTQDVSDDEDEGFLYWWIYLQAEMMVDLADPYGLARAGLGHYLHPEHKGKYFMTAADHPAISALYGIPTIPGDIYKKLGDSDNDFTLSPQSYTALGLPLPPVPFMVKAYNYWLRTENKKITPDRVKKGTWRTTPAERSYLLDPDRRNLKDFFLGGENEEEKKLRMKKEVRKLINEALTQ